jgi:hypothetical protein
MKVSIASECWTPSKEIWIEGAIIRYNIIVGGEPLRAAFHKPVIRPADGTPPAARLHNSIHFNIAGANEAPGKSKAQGQEKYPVPDANPPAIVQMGCAGPDLNRGSLAPVAIGPAFWPAAARRARFSRGGMAPTDSAPRSLSSIGTTAVVRCGRPPSLAEVLLITHLER